MKKEPLDRRKLSDQLRSARLEKSVKTIKRKLKIDPEATVEPGDLITKAKELSEVKKVSIAGLV